MFIIATTERQEYPRPVKLDSVSCIYFAIPASIILAKEVNDKRVTTFSFFSIYRGLNCGLFFSINNIVKWTGRQPDRHKNGINSKILKSVEYMKNNEYLTYSEELTNSSFIEASFNLSKLSQECEYERFAVIYLDELKLILDYQNSNLKDAYLNNDIILLVFAYLRMKIYKRRNGLLPDEINIDNKNSHEYDIASRKQRAPEAYNCFYCEIAEDLGLSARTISKAVDILKELNLIYSESLPRIKYYEGNVEKWKTDHTIFSNVYKREGNYLLAGGENYYLLEIENKKKKLNIIKEKNRKEMFDNEL